MRLRPVKRGRVSGYAAIVDGESGPVVGGVPDAHDPRRLLFTTPGGHPVHQGNFYRRTFHPAVLAAVAAGQLPKAKFVRVVERPGRQPREVVRLRFHDLRHASAAFTLQAAGNVEAGLFVVQSRLGHRNIKTTADIYGHLTRAADRQVAEGISAIVKRPAAAEA